MQSVVKELNQEWRSQGLPEFEMRLGIHQGPAVVGNLGSDKRSDYTAIGTTVNIASRIENIASAGEICISRSIYEQIKNQKHLELESIGSHSLKGVDDKVDIYKVFEKKAISGKNKVLPSALLRVLRRAMANNNNIVRSQKTTIFTKKSFSFC